MPRLIKRWKSRLAPVFQSDTAFIEAAYWEILGRPVDQDGLNHYRALLADGLGRTAVLLSLMRSAEFVGKLARSEQAAIADLRAIRPEPYGKDVDRTNGQTIDVFDARSPSDFDWLEAAIHEGGYYEQPGVWNLGVDVDKRVIAEIVAAFAPARPLELGCAAGAVLECLDQSGIRAEGVEISSRAIERAPPGVRERIHRGDLLSLTLDAGGYDMVFGLDVFEHLNPNRMDLYLQRMTRLLRDDGFVYCNIPAFGEDAEFGSVFPLYLAAWEHDAAAGRRFSRLHVDARGYPLHGHLTWADARWWAGRFAACGLAREVEIERQIHGTYGRFMAKRAPARRALFVFSKRASADRRAAIVGRLSQPSRALA